MGGGRGEIKPEFGKTDQLHTGDVIYVYFDAERLDRDEGYNNLAYLIDKDTTPYFIRGVTAEKVFVYYFWGIIVLYIDLASCFEKEGEDCVVRLVFNAHIFDSNPGHLFWRETKSFGGEGCL